MIIANPIYDVVFKYLMEDTEIARKLLSAIIGEDIISLESRTQEHSSTSPIHFLTVFRVDFKAVIRSASGEIKKVLIELQKSKKAFDILRFRHYLGTNYSKTDVVDGVEVALPIIPIYFLGFKLSIPTPVLKIGRTYQDVRNGATISQKDDFIEQLSHDCFVVQIPYLPPVTQTKLEKLLSVFNQKWIFDHEAEWLMRYPQSEEERNHDSDLDLLLRRLEAVVSSEDIQERIRGEEELDNFIANKLREGELALHASEMNLRAKDKALDRMNSMLKEKEDILKAQDDTLKAQDDILKAQDDTLKAQEDILKAQEDILKAKDEALKEAEKAVQMQQKATEELLRRLEKLEQQLNNPPKK